MWNARTATPLILALLTATLLAQDAPLPVFRSSVEVVEIDASVTDARGNPVTDLTRDDFEVIENGRPQPIVSFSLVNLPIERRERPLFAARAIEPDVQDNSGSEGRIYVFALDEVSPAGALNARRVLRQFIERHMGANDLGAVMLLGRGRTINNQDLTGNRRLLLAAIDTFTGGFPDAPPGDQQQPGDAVTGRAPNQWLGVHTPEERFQLRIRSETLKKAVEYLTHVGGRRKSVFLVSEGLGSDSSDLEDYHGQILSDVAEDIHSAITLASRNSIAFYPLDPRGLTTDLDGSQESGTEPDARSAASLQDMVTRQALSAFGELTGGFAITNTNNFEDAFDRVVTENSTYYLIGYSPENPKRDGRFHKIEVRVKRPGLSVRSRSGYMAPLATDKPQPRTKSTTLSASVADALASPMAIRDVPLRVTAAAFKGADKKAHVPISLEIDPTRLGLSDRNGIYQGQVEVAIVATAAGVASVQNVHGVVRLSLQQERYDRAARGGLRVISELQLPYGRYQLRATAGNTEGRAGSVVYDLEIPDFSKQPLTMSGVAVSKAGDSPDGVTIRLAQSLEHELPGSMLATREFTSSEQVALFVEVYENNPRRGAHTIDFTAELQEEGGKVVRTVTDQRSSSELKGKAGGYGFTPTLSLEGTRPGLYVVHVDARSSVGDRLTVSRDIQIKIK
jgi:VWFA-related protein